MQSTNHDIMVKMKEACEILAITLDIEDLDGAQDVGCNAVDN